MLKILKTSMKKIASGMTNVGRFFLIAQMKSYTEEVDVNAKEREAMKN